MTSHYFCYNRSMSRKLEVESLPYRENGFVFIYLLKDPLFPEKVRYVGKTVNPIKRYFAHTDLPRNKNRKYHAATWLTSLLRAERKPLMEIIEKVEDTESVYSDREKFWINHYRSNPNHELTNTTEGGSCDPTYGRLGKKNSPDHIRKCSLSRTGRSINQTDRNGNRRAAVLEAAKKRIGTHWGHHSEEGKSKISKGNTGKIRTDEFKKAISDRQRGKPNIHSYKKVSKLSVDGTLIETYDSIKDASSRNSLLRTCICNCLSGRSKSAGGFLWKYCS